MRKFFAVSLMCAFVLGITTLSWGQISSGSIEGSVADASGAVVPGVKLTAKNVATGAAFTATTSAAGLFAFPALPVGSYEVSAEHSGFATIVRKDVVVTIGAKIDLPLALAVAGPVETVTVTGETPILETTRTQVSSTVDARAVSDLPVNGRNFIDFVLLTPGVTRDVRLGDISFAGQRGTLNSLTVDGADDNNSFFGQTVGRTGSGRAPYQFSQDAVQEFQVNSNSYSAELGRAGGAVINVVTKSGSNKLHGTAFEFYRDRSLNATDIIDKINGRPKSAYHFNQFGGNLGGPLKKDKLFFFFDYDGQRNTQLNTVALSLPKGFALSTLPVVLGYQQQALNYLNARAASWGRTLNQNTYLTKIDWNITPNHLLSGRWNNQRFTGQGFENGGLTNSSEHTGASLVQSDTAAFTLTSTLSATWVSIARLAYVRDREPGLANSVNPEAIVRQSGQTLLTVGRNFFSPRETTINRWQWGDTISHTQGRHTVKLGGDSIHDSILNFFPGNFSGSYTFNSLESFGRNLAGAPVPAAGDRFVQAFAGAGTRGPTTHPDILEVSLFAQDDWRLRPGLTLNLGLRWDLQHLAEPKVANPAASLSAAGINTAGIHQSYNNFGPRFGFAWTPLKSHRLVARGGYGIFYGRTPSIMLGTAHSNNGVSVQTRTFTGGLIPQYPNTICGAPDPSGASPSCAAPTSGSSSNPIIFVFAPKYKQAAVQQANLGLEYEIAKNTSISANYLMVHGVHLQRTRDVNLPSTLTPTNIGIAGTSTVLTYLRFTGARPIALFDRISQFEGSANSLYHGLALQLKRRFSGNFQALASYTLGKVIDDVPDATAVVPFSFDDAKMLYNPLLPRLDRAVGNNDQRHRFVVSGIWDLNYAGNLQPVARALLGGWQISAIFTAQAGQPYSGQVNFDLNGDGNTNSERTPGQARNAFTLPATYSLDPRITRTVSLGERSRLQLIVEAFNIFNRANVLSVRNTQFARALDPPPPPAPPRCAGTTNPCLVPQTAGVTAFGVPTSIPGVGPQTRIFQLAAKVSF